MENNQDTKALLMRLEKHSRQQALFTKVLCILCAAVLVCALVLTVAIAGVTMELKQTIPAAGSRAGGGYGRAGSDRHGESEHRDTGTGRRGSKQHCG